MHPEGAIKWNSSDSGPGTHSDPPPYVQGVTRPRHETFPNLHTCLFFFLNGVHSERRHLNASLSLHYNAAIAKPERRVGSDPTVQTEVTDVFHFSVHVVKTAKDKHILQWNDSRMCVVLQCECSCELYCSSNTVKSMKAFGVMWERVPFWRATCTLLFYLSFLFLLS